MGLTEGVATRDEGHRLLVVHSPCDQRLTDIPRRSEPGPGCRSAFRVHIDQSHLNSGEGILEFPVTGVAFCLQATRSRAPVDVLFRFPDVLTPASETEGLETHRFQGNVSGEDHQVSPGDFPAVLLLDRPEQSARLVEVRVVGPTIEGRKALVAVACAAAPVAYAVGAGAVPGIRMNKGP